MTTPTPLAPNTKIVATLGPATWEADTLLELLEAGVNVCRINASHSDHEGIRRQVARVRRAASRANRAVSVLLDLQGPKIRTGRVDSPLALPTGSTLTVVMDESYVAEGNRTGTTYPEMAGDVSVGDRVLFADGALSGAVTEIRLTSTPPEVDIKMDQGGLLGSHKGINLPNVEMSVPSLTEKDLGDAKVGYDVGVDYIALSFVRKARDVEDLRAHMRAHGTNIPIIAKIEKPEALDNLSSILDVADGLMVARGDLGVEVPLETVPVHQKRMIAQAGHKGKLVITATQMLDSMERNPRPTRAETTDVANAVIDGTDAVMLSGETSIGKFPVQAVQTMRRIAKEVEASRFVEPRPIPDLPFRDGAAGAAYRAAAFSLSETPRPLMVFTWSGQSARFVSHVRPPAPIFAFSPNQPVVDQLALVWGVIPFKMPMVHTIEEMVSTGTRLLLASGHLKAGDEVVILGGSSPIEGSTNFVKWQTLEG